jgi:uncharacterized protein (DUF58 family)
MFSKHDLFLSIRRTVVPFVVGALGASVAGPYLPEVLLTEWLTVALATVYYVALRALEVQFPKVGILLGGSGQPTYVDPELEKRAFEDFIRALKAIEEDEATVLDIDAQRELRAVQAIEDAGEDS